MWACPIFYYTLHSKWIATISGETVSVNLLQICVINWEKEISSLLMKIFEPNAQSLFTSKRPTYTGQNYTIYPVASETR